MDDMKDILERTSLRHLGRLILDGGVDLHEDALSERQVRILLEDELTRAVKHGWKNPEQRLRGLMEKSWSSGEMVGFMKGLRAGARMALALVGEGEVRV